MVYCTVDDLKAAASESVIVRLTDETDSGTVNSVVAQWAIDSAGVEIDARVGSREVADGLLKRLNTDLAVCALYGRSEVKMPEQWVKRGDNALSILEGIAAGSIGFARVQVYSRDQVFTADEVKRF
jgi:phage gp36-like protein